MDHLATAPPEVQRIVEALQHGIALALGENLVGLYLTGSLTYGDFDPGGSDIDYLAVLHQPLSQSERDRLADLHDAIGMRYPIWRERIEGSYVTTDMIPSIEPPSEPRPYVNQGAFWNPDPPYGNEWLINRYVLQECGRALVGPTFTDLVPRVAIDAVRAASARDLFDERLPEIADPDFLPDSHHEAYVTLTICRIIHRHFNDDVVSKRQAARWVHDRVEPRWQNLIDAARAWSYGQHLGRRDDIRAFMIFTGHVLTDPGPQWTDG